jgi:peroxiredoxin
MVRATARGLCFLAATALLTVAAVPRAPQVQQGEHLLGKPAPDFTLSDLKGRKWQLSGLRRHKVVVIDFGRTYCTGCEDTMRDLQRVHAAYAARGVQVFTVCLNAEDRDSIREMTADCGTQYPALLDTDLAGAQAFGVKKVPCTFIIQRSGYVHWVITGHPENYADLVRKQLDGLLQHR